MVETPHPFVSPPVRIGSLRLSRPFLLAPMAGYTDSAFRRVCREMGAALVYTELVSADGSALRVRVCDNGSGVSAAAARKIFRAGFTTKKRGWGLGLSLVKRIVEEYHGGRISLTHSRPGDTVFEVTLPNQHQEHKSGGTV